MLSVEEFIKSQEKEETGITAFKINILNSCNKIVESTPFMVQNTPPQEAQIHNSLVALDTNIRMLEKYYGVESKIEVPKHYTGSQDVISFLEDRVTVVGFMTSMIFNIVKYTVRLGRKDDEAKEVEKIRIYFTRMKNYIETGYSLHD